MYAYSCTHIPKIECVLAYALYLSYHFVLIMSIVILFYGIMHNLMTRILLYWFVMNTLLPHPHGDAEQPWRHDRSVPENSLPS